MPFMPSFLRRHKDSSAKHANSGREADMDKLAHSVAMLTVVDPQGGGHRTHQDSAFVGGFRAAVNGTNPRATRPSARPPSTWASATPASYPPSPGPLPRPPLMQMPEPDLNHPTSKTMQYALFEPSDSFHPPHGLRPPSADVSTRPHSDPNVPSRPAAPVTPKRPPPLHAPASAPPKSISARGAASSVQPAHPHRQRSASVGGTTVEYTVTTVECSGTTLMGEKCRKRVRSRAPLASMSAEADAELPRFCHFHTKRVLAPSGFPVTGRPDVKYDKYIKEYLQTTTQANLRVEMDRAISNADVYGYIYAYKILDPSTPDKLHIKVGRAVKPVKRIEEWSRQCGSKEQILLGFWPWNVPADKATLMRGRETVGDPGPWCHRWERLVHLELADLAVNAQYLDPRFPNVPAPDTAIPARVSQKKPCGDCGAMHKEIFTLTRVLQGKYRGKEWELLVKPMIEKWGDFLQEYCVPREKNAQEDE